MRGRNVIYSADPDIRERAGRPISRAQITRFTRAGAHPDGTKRQASGSHSGSQRWQIPSDTGATGPRQFVQLNALQSDAIDPSVFYALYTAGVVIPRLTIPRMLARLRPATATTVLLAGMCSSLAGFCLAGHDLDIYGASSALLGVSYGLAYPLIQAQAADSVPGQLRHWALWYFSLAYFAGLYGFPLIAGAISTLGGYQALIACLLGVAALELAVSARTARPTTTKQETDHNPDKETVRWTPLRQPTAP